MATLSYQFSLKMNSCQPYMLLMTQHSKNRPQIRDVTVWKQYNIKWKDKWAQYLSPQLRSAGSAARAAEGRGHCNDPCFSALAEGGKRSQGEFKWVHSCREDNYIYPLYVFWWSLPRLQTERKQQLIMDECKESSCLSLSKHYLICITDYGIHCSHLKDNHLEYNYTASLKS